MQKLLQKFESIYFWIFLGIIVFIPLYPKFPLINVPLTYVAIRLEDVLIALGFALAILLQLKRVKNLFKMAIVRSFALYWFIGIIAVISGVFVTSTIAPHLGLLHWLRRIEYMSLFFMAITAIKSVRQIKIILLAFVAVTLAICFYGFGQQWLQFPVISTTNREFSKGQFLTLTPDARVNSTFAGHYDLAIYLVMVLAILSSMFFYFRSQKDSQTNGFGKFLKNWNMKSLFYQGMIALTGGLSFILLGMTAARLSFVAAIFAVITSLFLNKKWILIVAFIIMAVGTVAVIPELRYRLVATFTVNFLGGGGAKYTPENTGETDTAKRLGDVERKKIFDDATAAGLLDPEKTATIASDLVPGEPINTTELGVYRSFKIRTDVEWPRAYRAFLRNPALGTGFSSLGIASDNDVLRSLGETGILGTLSFSLIFIIVFKKLWTQYKSQNRFAKYLAVGMLAMVAGFLINSLFIDVFEASKVATLFWAFLGINWRLSSIVRKESNV